MPLDVTLTFPTSAEATAALAQGITVRRCELREELSALFELRVEVLSADPALAERAFVGQLVVCDFGDEPFVEEITGIVCRMEQRTAVPGGSSLYMWTIVPPLWLTTRRRDHRIFQDMSVPQIVDAVLADPRYGGRIAAPTKLLAGHEPREYVVQYGETDWDFLARILADAGITSFFDHPNGSAWTLIDDTSSRAPTLTDGPIPFAAPQGMSTLDVEGAGTPHVSSAVIASNIETSAVTIRDYDFEKPAFRLEAKKALDDGAAFAGEAGLEAYLFEAGAFTAQRPGDVRAETMLEAERALGRRILCAASFALPPGTRMTLVDHPRDDLNTDLLVVREHAILEVDGASTHELELMDLARRFRPARRLKPRIAGTQTAFVVGAEGEEIDVDAHGRLLVAFPWDRRDRHAGSTSRRVRVAEGWAGADRGFVMLPRVKDEVMIAYLDGDPDQPIVVGSVHNAVSTVPAKLPGQRTRTIWKSRSTPGGEGFNAILMEGAAGGELLALKAQRDFRSDVGRNTKTVIGQDETVEVTGDRRITVQGDEQVAVTGTRRVGVGGPQFIDGKAMTVTGTKMQVNGTEIVVDTNELDVGATTMTLHSDGTISIAATEIRLTAGGSTITLGADGIRMEAPLIELNP